MDHTTLNVVHLSTSLMWSQIQCYLGPIQATSPHRVLPWTYLSHWSTWSYQLPYTILWCSLTPSVSLDLSKPLVHPSIPLDFIQATGPSSAPFTTRDRGCLTLQYSVGLCCFAGKVYCLFALRFVSRFTLICLIMQLNIGPQSCIC